MENIGHGWKGFVTEPDQLYRSRLWVTGVGAVPSLGWVYNLISRTELPLVYLLPRHSSVQRPLAALIGMPLVVCRIASCWGL